MNLPSDKTGLAAMIDELMLLLHESAEFHNPRAPQAGQVLRSACLALRRLGHRLRRDPYVVAVVGKGKVGKSTLLNALLGADLVPKRIADCTLAPIEISFGATPGITVYYRGDFRREQRQFGDLDAVRRRLAEIADLKGADASANIERISVEVPLPTLVSGLFVADTPGFAQGATADDVATQEAALTEYLKTRAAQVFLVVRSDFGKRELGFYQQCLTDLCTDLLVTHADRTTPEGRDEFRRLYRDRFAQHLRFHFVSGQWGVQARQRNDADLLVKSGIADLQQRLADLADPVRRHGVIRAELLELGRDVGFWLKRQRDGRGQPLQSRWRPDSWSRWARFVPDDDLKQRLTHELGGEP